MLVQARWSRFADGADEIHKWRVAEAVISAYRQSGTTIAATGNLPL
jgi:acyl-CoA dehydrogenase